MKVFLDDIRNPMEYWDIIAKNYSSIIELLQTGKVTEISLDHDLGTEKTGYDVLLWIEEQTAINNFKAPKIWVHTGNLSAKEKMILAINKIEKLIKEKDL
jgi:hypothetical protein